jgi:rhodanese-related sulfurtransferase
MNLETLFEFAQSSPLLSIGFAALTLAIVYTEISRLFLPFKSVNPAQLTRLINQDNAMLVDFSPMNDFEKAHIAGAKNIQISQFDAGSKPFADHKDSAIAVMCKTGMQSSDIAKKLAKAGFKKVFWLDGGLSAWQGADLPVVKGRH